jgi:MFS family permease
MTETVNLHRETSQNPSTRSISPRGILIASSLGTVFEWYDFFLYGSLATFIARHFFAKADPATGLIFALLAFAAGFIVRPFGALVFGRLGDMIGRKYTFLATILIMGASTFGVGLLPTYETVGIAAPMILVTLRLLQGLALGGEYGGAAVYVAEHAPAGRRGLFTSWIQTTATLGLFLSLLVILGCRLSLGEEAFAQWGWRLPFLLSLVLLAISVWIRLAMNESPVFEAMKREGSISRAPLTESFLQWANLRRVLIALFGLTAGLGCIWYASQFYVMLFLTQTLKVDGVTANVLVAAALAIATPLFVVFGALSDRIGRKPIIMAGLALSVITYFPIFKGLTHFANPALERALAESPVVLQADPAQCSFQFNPTGTQRFTSSCDIAKAQLVTASVNFRTQDAPAGTVATIQIGDQMLQSFDATALDPSQVKARTAALARSLSQLVAQAGYPLRADPAAINTPMVLALIVLLVVYVTMIYGPTAAALAELFPARLRYSSMSLPYHIGTGWFGGLLPTTAFALVAVRGNIYDGLWYPVLFAAMSLVVGLLCLPETRHADLSR